VCIMPADGTFNHHFTMEKVLTGLATCLGTAKGCQNNDLNVNCKDLNVKTEDLDFDATCIGWLSFSFYWGMEAGNKSRCTAIFSKTIATYCCLVEVLHANQVFCQAYDRLQGYDAMPKRILQRTWWLWYQGFWFMASYGANWSRNPNLI